jgi:hypothetical protein
MYPAFECSRWAGHPSRGRPRPASCPAGKKAGHRRLRCKPSATNEDGPATRRPAPSLPVRCTRPAIRSGQVALQAPARAPAPRVVHSREPRRRPPYGPEPGPAPTSNPNTAARYPRQPLTPPGRAQPRQRALQPVALRPPIPIDQGVSKRIVAVACHQRTGATWAKRLFASLRHLFCARE